MPTTAYPLLESFILHCLGPAYVTKLWTWGTGISLRTNSTMLSWCLGLARWALGSLWLIKAISKSGRSRVGHVSMISTTVVRWCAASTVDPEYHSDTLPPISSWRLRCIHLWEDKCRETSPVTTVSSPNPKILGEHTQSLRYFAGVERTYALSHSALISAVWLCGMESSYWVWSTLGGFSHRVLPGTIRDDCVSVYKVSSQVLDTDSKHSCSRIV